MYSIVTGHDTDINYRKGFLYGYYQPDGVSGFSAEPCSTVVFGQVQLMVSYENNTVKIRIRIYNAGTDTWHVKDIV